MEAPEEFRAIARQMRALQVEMDRLIPLLDENGLPFVDDTPIDEETWEAWERASDDYDALNERLRLMVRRHFPKLRP